MAESDKHTNCLPILSLPCWLWATALMGGFLCAMLFTEVFTFVRHVYQLPTLLQMVFIPQFLAAAIFVDMFPRAWPIWVKLIPAMVPAFAISLVEARLFLGVANRVGLKTAGPIVVAIVAIATYHMQSPDSCSGEWFWERVLLIHSHIVEEGESHLTFVWSGRDSHVFFRVSHSAVKAAARKSINQRIEQLIRWMETEKIKGEADDSMYRDLKTLTSVDLGPDPAPWRAWWTRNQSTFVGSPTAYEDLRKARLAYENEQLASMQIAQPDPSDQSEARWRKNYRRSQLWRRTSMGVAVACIAFVLIGYARRLTK